jgi:predicted nucleic acid-binding protein
MEKMALGKAVVTSFDVLIDSDAFVGRYYPNDSHHQAAIELFESLQSQRLYSVTTSMVIDEVATVLSHRQGQDQARLFLRRMQDAKFPMIFVDERLRAEGHKIFVAQSRKGTSITDCCNVAVMNRFNISQIFTFDQMYRKDLELEIYK